MEIQNFSSSVEKYFTSEHGEDNMIFSHVKISSFHAKAHLVFHWCLYNKKKSLSLSLSRANDACIYVYDRGSNQRTLRVSNEEQST